MTEHNPEDYVLVHKSKAKISRARKMVIGIMAVGAVAALTGAGTFASFSASTSNDATFSTAKLVLGNGKDAVATCFSDDTTTPGNHANNLDENDKSCTALFATSLKPGQTATAGVELVNDATSTIAGALKLAADAACAGSTVSGSAGTAADSVLCDHMQLTIQQTDAYNSWATTNTTCAFPAAAVACSTLTSGTVQNFTTEHRFSDSGGNDSVSLIATPKGALTLVSSLPKETGGGNGTVRYVISITFPNTLTCGGGAGAGFSSTGIGCDNPYMNKNVAFKLRWLLTA